jgi:uncharacterized protein
VERREEDGVEKSGRLSPVRGSERVVALDVLRGMGIVGILLVNIGLFSGARQIFPTAPPDGLPIYDRIVEFLISAFAEGKFISTLAFLFGLGFAWQGMRAEERGESSGKLLLKRVSVLGLFGLVHAIFVWSGDILLMYALAGFVLILFRRRRPKTLLIWAGISIGVPILLLLVAIVFFLVAGDAGQMAQSQSAGFPFAENLAESAREAYNSGSYAEMVIQRLREIALLALGVFFFGPFVFAMMLAGAAVARAGWMRDVRSRRAGIKKAAVAGFSVGLPLNAAYAITTVLDPAATGLAGLVGAIFWMAGAPLLAIGYMAAMTLFVFRRPEGAVAHRLASVGRLALSNYLLQSVVMTAVFYGLAIYGELGITASLAVALVLLAAQLALSPVYLERFSTGPAEWLWRRLTYGRKSARASA